MSSPERQTEAPEPTEALDDPRVRAALLEELATLDAIEYDRRREEEAKQLGVRVKTLDDEVARRRPQDNNGHAGQGSPVVFEEIEPWPDVVDGATLLNGLVAAYKRFVALPPGGAEALALWTVHTHAHDAASVSPILSITSPEKRCGKTTTLRVLGALVPRHLPTSNTTLAPLFRSIEKWRPTLLVDEADTFLRDDDSLIGALNSGHCRETAWLLRSVGDDHEPKRFHTWGAKAVAFIGRAPGTLEDRSITVRLQRRRPDEQVERFRLAREDPDLKVLAQQSARWAADYMALLREAEPDPPGGLHDRAIDNWEPLLAIADLAGGRWPKEARRVAVLLSGGDEDESSYRVTLLGDIGAIFKQRGGDRLPSADLCEALAGMEDRPWPEWKKGKPITTRQLAQLLKPFGVSPTTIKQADGSTIKGYLRERFDGAFARYLPNLSVTTSQPTATEGLSGFAIRNQEGEVTDRNRPKLAPTQGCDGVTDENPGIPDPRVHDQESDPTGDDLGLGLEGDLDAALAQEKTPAPEDDDLGLGDLDAELWSDEL